MSLSNHLAFFFVPFFCPLSLQGMPDRKERPWYFTPWVRGGGVTSLISATGQADSEPRTYTIPSGLSYDSCRYMQNTREPFYT